jgi:hypothetical protein
VTDFLDQKRTEITARLRELEPLVKEFKRLQDAAAALTAVSGSSPAPAPRASTPTAAGRSRASRRPPKSTAASATLAATPAKGRRGGRPKGSGTRAAQALSLVQGQPGITIPELAAKMKIKQNYLYRVLPGLEQEGKITKRGRGWHPKS